MKPPLEEMVAASLFAFLASGGTVERALTELPGLKPQIRAALERMSPGGYDELERSASRLRDVICRKDEAIRVSDFNLAAKLRDDECAIFESVGLPAPAGEAWFTVLRVAPEKQLLYLSALLSSGNATECEPGALPNGGPAERSGNSGVGGGPPSVS
jgi:hypothetical protein